MLVVFAGKIASIGVFTTKSDDSEAGFSIRSGVCGRLLFVVWFEDEPLLFVDPVEPFVLPLLFDELGGREGFVVFPVVEFPLLLPLFPELPVLSLLPLSGISGVTGAGSEESVVSSSGMLVQKGKSTTQTSRRSLNQSRQL